MVRDAIASEIQCVEYNRFFFPFYESFGLKYTLLFNVHLTQTNLTRSFLTVAIIYLYQNPHFAPLLSKIWFKFIKRRDLHSFTLLNAFLEIC